MNDPTVPLWKRLRELEDEQKLHNISIDAATARAERAEAEVERLREENTRLWEVVKKIAYHDTWEDGREIADRFIDEDSKEASDA